MKILFFLLLSALSGFGQSLAGSTNHYGMLKNQQMFYIAGGFTGATSPAGHSLMAVAKQKDAATVFAQLTREASPTAQLFGLLGLQMISPDQFKNALPGLLKSKSQVTVLNGCMAMNRDVASVAKEIEQGRWNLGAVTTQAR